MPNRSGNRTNNHNGHHNQRPLVITTTRVMIVPVRVRARWLAKLIGEVQQGTQLEKYWVLVKELFCKLPSYKENRVIYDGSP